MATPQTMTWYGITQQRVLNLTGRYNPFRAPEPLPILNPSNFVPKNGFPVAKGLTPLGLKRENIARKVDGCTRI